MTAAFLLVSVLSADAWTWSKKQPLAAPETNVERAAAVQFAWTSFDAKAARKWKAPWRRKFTLWNQEKITVAFDKPAIEPNAVSWTGKIESSKLPPGVTLVVQGKVVSAHFSLDDGRRFELTTRGGQVWLRQLKIVEMREAAPRQPPID